MELDEQFVLGNYLFFPILDVNLQCPVKVRSIVIHSPQLDVLRQGHPAKGRFLRSYPPPATVDYPLENPHILAKTGPEKFFGRTLPEPVHVKDPWRSLQFLPHLQPVSKVFPHVVPAEGKHRHWIATNLSHG